ncbi:MAG: hypothetical protein A4S09_15115 [Proteobacteria bacterium SG_bin7]|nr:MAG: hypothetical protein A4S09_15115 [Proteobacteria bacterium SG_bin7]
MGPLEKALAVNRDDTQYGTFAEIGAGQEVARFFFQAGLASHTIAKTISAYDMIFSDAIYGQEKNGRYVCEPRVLKMVEKEFRLLVERLDEKRGANTCFFSFADTIATHSGPNKQNHGWLGMRFQVKPRGASNDIVLHVRMLDRARLNQQEALGTLGVNLVYGAIYLHKNVGDLVSSLTDAIKKERIEIDMIRVEGPDLSHIDKIKLNLELLKTGLAPAVLFTANGNPAQPSEVFFKRPLIVKRLSLRVGSEFTPERGWHKVCLDHFEKLNKEAFKDHLKLIEISIDEDYNEAIPVIQKLLSLGQNILISRFARWVDLKSFLRQHSNQFVALNVMWDDLHKVFDDSSYKDFEGGLVEGLGKLVGENNCVLLVDNTLAQDREIDFSAPHRSLYNYFRDNKKLINMY